MKFFGRIFLVWVVFLGAAGFAACQMLRWSSEPRFAYTAVVEIVCLLIIGASVPSKWIKAVLFPVALLSLCQILSVFKTGSFLKPQTLAALKEGLVEPGEAVFFFVAMTGFVWFCFCLKPLKIKNGKLLGLIILALICMESYRKIPFPLHALNKTIKITLEEWRS